jgi:hypothetical protein
VKALGVLFFLLICAGLFVVLPPVGIAVFIVGVAIKVLMK